MTTVEPTLIVAPVAGRFAQDPRCVIAPAARLRTMWSAYAEKIRAATDPATALVITNHRQPIVAVLTEKAWQGGIEADRDSSMAAPEITTVTTSGVRQALARATAAADKGGVHHHITYHSRADRIVMVDYRWARRHGLVPEIDPQTCEAVDAASTHKTQE